MSGEGARRSEEGCSERFGQIVDGFLPVFPDRALEKLKSVLDALIPRTPKDVETLVNLGEKLYQKISGKVGKGGGDEDDHSPPSDPFANP